MTQAREKKDPELKPSSVFPHKKDWAHFFHENHRSMDDVLSRNKRISQSHEGSWADSHHDVWPIGRVASSAWLNVCFRRVLKNEIGGGLEQSAATITVSPSAAPCFRRKVAVQNSRQTS